MKRKYLLIFILGLFWYHASNAQGGVKISAPIKPNAPSDEYPTHIDSLGLGGFMAVTNIDSRNNITTLRRKLGMLVYVIEDDVLYQLKGGTNNANWVAVPLGGGGSGNFSWLGNAGSHPTSPNQYSAYYNTTDKISYIWDGDSWEILARDGSAGAQGPQGIQGLQGPAGTNGVSLSWQGSLATAPGSPTLNMAYYNTADKRSYVWDGDSWEILSQDGSDGATGAQGPQGIQGLQGPAGTNGVSLSWQGSLATAPGSPTLNMAYYNTADKRSYVWDGDSWEILSQDGATGSQGPQGIQGLQGPAGTNGVSLSWQGSLATVPGSPTLNMAYYNTADKRSYVWDGDSWEILSQDGSDGATGAQGPQGIQGLQGPAGTNGVSLSWQGSLATAPSSPTLNMAYYNTADKRSYVWDGDSWEILSQDGATGSQGPAGTNGVSLSWQGSLATAPGSPTLNMAYYNTADKRSYVWDGDSWEILSQDGIAGATGPQGPQGAQGPAGPAGANGISVVWQGPLAEAPTTPTLNMGYYNTTLKRSYIWDGSVWQTIAQDGINLYWLGELGYDPLPYLPYLIYRRTSTGITYMSVFSEDINDNIWVIIAKDGLQGEPGVEGPAGAGFFWMGEFDAEPTGDIGLYSLYRNTITKKVYIYDGAAWQILVQDGADGSGGGGSAFNGNRPITASVFTGTNPGTNDIAQWLEYLFYPTQVPTASLTMTYGGNTQTSFTLERMADGAALSATLNWGAGRQASTATLSTISVAGNTQSFAQPAQGASVTGTQAVNLTRNSNTTLSNIVLTSDSKSAQATVSVNFSFRRYVGFVTQPGGVVEGEGFIPTPAEILALANQPFASSRGFSNLSVTPSGPQRLVIAYPVAWDPGPTTSAQIYVGGFAINTGAYTRDVISFTNASGAVENYVVYTWKTNTNDPVSVTVQ